VLAITLILSLTTSDALAWQVRLNDQGNELSWDTKSIPYAINSAGAHGMSDVAIESMVAASTRNWAAPVAAGISWVQQANTAIMGADPHDAVNAIYFDDHWTQDPSLLGLTYVWSTTDGEIVGFDMALNATHHEWSVDGSDDSNDLLNTLSHEFGHALGVDHSPSIEIATMYPSTFPGELVKRDLDTDDIDALLYLYDVAEKDPAAAGCSTAPHPSHHLGWLVLLPLVALRRTRTHGSPCSQS